MPQTTIPENLLVNSSELDESRRDLKENTGWVRPNAEQAFTQLYGDCEKLENARAERCKLDRALKAFLSHWTVGGQLPSTGGSAGESTR